MTINYIFYSLQSYGSWNGPFKELFEAFMETYIREAEDEEIFEVIQPFYAWRALVLASPIWYPTLSSKTRKTILTFALNMLKSSFFEWKNIESYLGYKKEK
jgi:aminoglycoside phosphotransferase family enzyme